MATQVTPVSQQIAWLLQDNTNKYLNDTGDLSAPEAYNHAASPWTSDYSGNDQQRVVFDLTTEANTFLLKFWGRPASTPPDPYPSSTIYAGLGAVWGISKLVNQLVSPTTTEYLGEYLGKFELVVGRDQVASGTLLPDTEDPEGAATWISEINILEDRSIFPAFRVIGQQGDAAPVLAFDSMGYSQIIVEMRSTLPAGFSRAGYDTASAPTDLGCLRRVL